MGLDKLILKFVQRNIIPRITNIVLKSDPTQYFKAIILQLKVNKTFLKSQRTDTTDFKTYYRELPWWPSG